MQTLFRFSTILSRSEHRYFLVAALEALKHVQLTVASSACNPDPAVSSCLVLGKDMMLASSTGLSSSYSIIRQLQHVVGVPASTIQGINSRTQNCKLTKQEKSFCLREKQNTSYLC
mmetsp:Transcript_11132/g.25230  ORF Transcript_11132/g.25230 Transcript_11132/m.25230 type:complete len:116 (-) Transcript_11132:8-355(-)